MLLGRLPRVSAGPLPLPGSVATVCQGNLVPAGAGHVAVGPAYRMVCDLADDALWTALPGGIDGDPLAVTYRRWLDAWATGHYHRLVPHHGDESS
jgi:acyl-homoserine lactone acylase PvdQ